MWGLLLELLQLLRDGHTCWLPMLLLLLLLKELLLLLQDRARRHAVRRLLEQLLPKLLRVQQLHALQVLLHLRVVQQHLLLLLLQLRLLQLELQLLLPAQPRHRKAARQHAGRLLLLQLLLQLLLLQLLNLRRCEALANSISCSGGASVRPALEGVQHLLVWC